MQCFRCHSKMFRSERSEYEVFPDVYSRVDMVINECFTCGIFIELQVPCLNPPTMVERIIP